ncbi:MAG: type II secretion system protein GspD [Bacteroidota bacterium]
MKKIIICLVAVVISFGAPSSSIFAQRDIERTLTGASSPDEIVTLSENLSFNQAIEILSSVSQRATGKKIVSTVQSVNPIGVLIEKMHYKKAMTIIVQYADLMYEEGESTIIIKKKSAAEAPPSKDVYASVDSREIKISAVFFEADTYNMRERGINWQNVLKSSDMELGVNFSTAGQSSSESDAVTQGFEVNAGGTYKIGNFTGNALSLFKFFESENLGEIIANPSIVVRDNQSGRIQIGSDYSVKQRDFAGNTTEKFFSTGSIINVTPHYYNEDNVDYVLLSLDVERSSAIPSEVSTEIRKTAASTQVLMLNGEETVIGGLFVNDETVVRAGIPVLKDLPWWVLGIRYLAGSDQKSVKKKEVLILVKTEILPTLKERINGSRNENKLHKEIEKSKQKMQYYKFNSFEEKK